MISLKHLLWKHSSALAAILVITQAYLLPAQTNCPDVNINFNIPPVVCFDPSNSIVDLDVEVIGGDGTGTGQWAGDNITNTTTGFFRTTFASPGEQKIYYTYTEGNCTYQDSTTFLYSRLSTPVFLASSEQAGHLCQDSFSILRVISNYDPSTTNLIWDLAGGTSVEQGRPDSLHVNWDSPGSKLISLQYEQYGCLSQPIIQQVVLDPVIDTPMVACDNTLEQLVFEWNDPPNSSATVVFVISGPNGVADTVEDRYTIDNLLPGQIVQVRLVTSSDNTCDGNSIDPICQSISCDGDLIELAPIGNACFSGGPSDTIDLDYILFDTITPSTLTWSGAGVFDPTQARIVVDPSMAGSTQWVYVQFESANCIVTDSVSFELVPPPVANFNVPSTACVNESVTANFTFGPIAPNSDTSLIWDFGDALVSGDPSTGTAELNWTTPGTKIVRLAIQDGACVSAEATRFVNVQSGPEAAEITCESSPNRVRFTWQDIPGTTFDVTVINGPPGVRLSTTSYEISGLTTDDDVTIEVTTNGAGLCNTTTVMASCSPLICPDVDLSINPIDSFCLGAPSSNQILTAAISGGSGNGILSWSGPNVSGDVWTPDNSLSDQMVTLSARYEEDGCRFEDSIVVAVQLRPDAFFELDSMICMRSGSTVVVTNPNSSTATYDWQINNISIPSLIGPGPHEITWDSAGNQQLSLEITSELCGSSLHTESIAVQASFPAVELSCTPEPDQILFTWDPVPGVMEYLVEVLEGPAGDRTSDTSILFANLTPGQEIQIAVVIENEGDCPESRTELSCIAANCPPASVSIDRSLLPESICIGDQDTSFLLDAMVTNSNGTGTLVFSGTGVSDTERSWLVTPAMAGQTYTITATYSEGACIFSEAVDVVVNAIPVADFTVDSLACPGDIIVIQFTGQASAGTTFNWSIDSISGIGPHQIVFEETVNTTIALSLEQDNCPTQTIQRVVNRVFKHPDPTVFCESGLDEILYTWSPPADDMRTEVILNGPGTGTQTSDTSFVVTDLAAETNTSITVQFIDDQYPCRNSGMSTVGCSTIACDPLSIAWSVPTAVCEGEAVVISFTTQGAGDVGFDLVFSQNGQTTTSSGIKDGSTLTFMLSEATTFNVIAAALPGNTTCTVELPDPLTVSVNSTTEVDTQVIFPSACEGTDTLITLSALLDQMPSGGAWSFTAGPGNPDTAFDPTAGSLRTAALTTGTYLFDYQLSSNSGCTDVGATAQIEILDTPVANAGPDLSLDCQFNIASLGSNLTTPNMIYRWTGTNNSALSDPEMAITEVTQAGIYTLEVSNPATGCTSTDEVSVSATSGMITSYTSVIPVSCYGQNDGRIIVDSISGGVSPYTFTLNGINQGNQSSFANLAPGDYDLQVRSDDGCEATTLIRLESPVELVVELTTNINPADLTVNIGDSVEITALINIPESQIATVRWIPSGSHSGTSLENTVYPTITSSYGVEITDVNGCTASDRLSIVVRKNSNTYIPTAFSPNEDGNNDIFFIQSDETVSQVRQLSIYNRWGKQIFTNRDFAPNDPSQGWDGNTRNQPEPTGVYVYWAELQLAGGELIQVSGDVALLR